MSGFAHMAFPNESAEYRKARNRLLEAEIALRRQTEEVAALRRALPPGGEIPEDFEFERIGAFQRPEKVKLSELFGEHSTLLLYSYMFGPEKDLPCPGCQIIDPNLAALFHGDDGEVAVGSDLESIGLGGHLDCLEELVALECD